jgi:hypothetical protein
MKTFTLVLVVVGFATGCASHESHMTSYPGDTRVSDCQSMGRSWNWISGGCK